MAKQKEVKSFGLVLKGIDGYSTLTLCAREDDGNTASPAGRVVWAKYENLDGTYFGFPCACDSEDEAEVSFAELLNEALRLGWTPSLTLKAKAARYPDECVRFDKMPSPCSPAKVD